jgi:hypothetical protein
MAREKVVRALPAKWHSPITKSERETSGGRLPAIQSQAIFKPFGLVRILGLGPIFGRLWVEPTGILLPTNLYHFSHKKRARTMSLKKIE